MYLKWFYVKCNEFRLIIVYWLIFFPAGGETKEPESSDTTLVDDKPGQGEPPKSPKAFYCQYYPLQENKHLNNDLVATFIDCLNLSHTQY